MASVRARARLAGRGGKGQTARSGVRIKGFEGGQMPLHRRLPKRGFNNIFKLDFAEINLDRLQEAIDAKLVDVKETVTAESLVKAGVLRRAKDGVRLLGRGEIKAKLEHRSARRLEIRDRGGREGRRHGEDPGSGQEGRRRGGVTSASSPAESRAIRTMRTMDLSKPSTK